jgi:hypothetical protein
VSEDRMSSKQYAKFEKVFYLYGSTIKIVEPVRPNEWQEIAEVIWSWAIGKVTALVEASIEPEIADYDDRPEVLNPNALLIRVKDKTIVKSGQNRNGPWALTQLIGTDNVAYSTFKGERYEVGKEYPVEVEQVTRGEKVYLQIKEPK